MSHTRRRADILAADGFATMREAWQYLAISRTQMYRLAAAGVISHANIGGRRVIPWAALREYAASRIVIGSVA